MFTKLHDRRIPNVSVGVRVGVGPMEFQLISTDILWRVFRILTEQVPHTFVSVNRRNNEAPGPHCTVKPVPLKYGKLATKCPWLYGYFYSVRHRDIQSLQHRRRVSGLTTDRMSTAKPPVGLQAEMRAAYHRESTCNVTIRRDTMY